MHDTTMNKSLRTNSKIYQALKEEDPRCIFTSYKCMLFFLVFCL